VANETTGDGAVALQHVEPAEQPADGADGSIKKSRSLFDPSIMRRAVGDSFK